MKKLASASGVLALAMLLASAANYLVNMVLARLLDPVQFGDASLMVTALLALTSVAVGVQLYTVQLTARARAQERARIARRLRQRCTMLGVAIGVVIVVASAPLRSLLRTESALPFVLLGLGMPAFLALSVERGILQGRFEFGRLASTYLVEAVVRTIATVGLVLAGTGAAGASAGLTLSLIASWAIAAKRQPSADLATSASPIVVSTAALRPLCVLLAGQVVINNGDVIMSKQLLDPELAGAYAAVALVGRAVFFASWAVVQAAFPSAVESDDHDASVAHGAVLLVAGFGLLSVVGMYVAAPVVAALVLGDGFSHVSSLLGPYAVATSLFATANVIATIDVAQKRSGTAWMVLVGAVVQTAAIAAFAESVVSIVTIQVVVMAGLLVAVGSTRVFAWYNGLRSAAPMQPARPRGVVHA